MQMKKFVLRLELQDNKEKRKALKTVSSLPGIDEISIDMKGKTLIVIGTADPVSVATKLRKFWPTSILLVGPAKEPEKKEELKKEEPKKEESKKEEEPKKEETKKDDEQQPKKDEQPPKKEGGGGEDAAAAKTEPAKKEEEKKPEAEAVTIAIPVPEPQPQPVVVGTVMPYRPYYPPMQQTYYHMHHSIEENPNACVIS